MMNPIARDLSDREFDDVAAYWSAQPAGGDAAVSAELGPGLAPELAASKTSKMGFPRGFPTGFVRYATSTSRRDARHA
jgi:hypothetical protein